MKPIYDAMHAMNPDVTLGVNIPWYDTSEAGDQALLNWILKHYVHSHHWFGTNSMKPYADGGVVDSSGHVYGTQNLVVADVSIFPLKVSCVACSFIPQAYVRDVLGISVFYPLFIYPYTHSLMEILVCLATLLDK